MPDDDLTQELLRILRQPGPIIELLREAYELGFTRGLLDETLKDALQ